MAGFITFAIPEHIINRAQEIRKTRDEHYSNLFPEAATDCRWVGEVGEICVALWLRSHSSLPVAWITRDVAGKPDIVIGEHSIDVKTVKRQGGVYPGYTVGMSARHAYEDVDYFFFTSYEFPRRRLWLLGAISQEDFLVKARFYQAGEHPHPAYTIRAGHEVAQISVADLIAPAVWLSSLPTQTVSV